LGPAPRVSEPNHHQQKEIDMNQIKPEDLPEVSGGVIGDHIVPVPVGIIPSLDGPLEGTIGRVRFPQPSPLPIPDPLRA
jgi:hypothetical protein